MKFLIKLYIFIYFQYIKCKFLKDLYTNTEDIYKKLDKLTEKCPSILSKKTYIEEKTNNTMKYYIINYKKNQKKNPTISLLLFGEHSRELISSELGIYIIENLCSIENKKFQSKYSKKTLKSILSENKIILIPLVNEYGRKIIEKELNECQRNNENDVDLNRNYPLNWIKDDSINSGKKPLSEWETRSINNIIKMINPKLLISTHSGDFKMYMPFGYKNISFNNFDNNLKIMYQILNDLNEKYCKCKFGPISSLYKFNVSGNLIDYAYETLKVKYVFAFEIFYLDNNNFFNNLYKSNNDFVFDYDNYVNGNNNNSFVQMKKINNSIMKKLSYSNLKSLFYQCISLKNPLDKSVFEKILLNWNNAFFQLFTMIYKIENN